MRIDELYPYWDAVHEEFVERVGLVSESQLAARPHDDAPSIQRIVLDFVYDERYWIGYIGAGHHYERPSPAEYAAPADLVDLMESQREATRRVLGTLTAAGLRAVRMVPADPATNRPETNVPLSWLFWRLLELELAAWGQVRLRLLDYRREKKPWE